MPKKRQLTKSLFVSCLKDPPRDNIKSPDIAYISRDGPLCTFNSQSKFVEQQLEKLKPPPKPPTNPPNWILLLGVSVKVVNGELKSIRYYFMVLNSGRFDSWGHFADQLLPWPRSHTRGESEGWRSRSKACRTCTCRGWAGCNPAQVAALISDF